MGEPELDPRALEELAAIRTMEDLDTFFQRALELPADEGGTYRDTCMGGCGLFGERWEDCQGAFLELAEKGWGGLSEGDPDYERLTEAVLCLHAVFKGMFEIRVAFSTLLIALGNGDDAVATLEPLIREFPDKKGPRVELAKVYVLQDKWAEALAHLDSEAALGEPTWDTRSLRAQAMANVFQETSMKGSTTDQMDRPRERLDEIVAEAEASLAGAPREMQEQIREFIVGVRTMDGILDKVAVREGQGRDFVEVDPERANDPRYADPVNGPPRWDFTLSEMAEVDVPDWPMEEHRKVPGFDDTWRRRFELFAPCRDAILTIQGRCPYPVLAWALAKVEVRPDELELGFFLYPTLTPHNWSEAVAQLLVMLPGEDAGSEVQRAWVDALWEDELTEVQRAHMQRAAESLAGGETGPAETEQGDSSGVDVPALARAGDVGGLSEATSLPHPPSVRSAAITALAENGGWPAIGHILDTLDDPDEGVRRTGMAALGGLGLRALRPILSSVREADPQQLEASAAALAAMGRTAVEPLIVAMGHADGNVRWLAAEALGRIGDPRCRHVLAGSRTDPFEDVQQACDRALGALNAASEEPTGGAGLPRDGGGGVTVPVPKAIAGVTSAAHPDRSTPAGKPRGVAKALIAVVVIVLLVGAIVGVVLNRRARERRAADAMADSAMAQLKVFKTHQGLAPGKEPRSHLDDALTLASQAATRLDTPKTRGTHALMQVYSANLNRGGLQHCTEQEQARVSLRSVTTAAIADQAPSAEGYLARALWAFKQCQCTRDQISDNCDEAGRVFPRALGAVPAGEELDWLRFEVLWQWQMHDLVSGHVRRTQGDDSGARASYERALERCGQADEYADSAPVNDAELYKNCGRAAAMLERWDDLATYSLDLASMDPEDGTHSGVGPLASLARMTVLRDVECQDVRLYTSPKYTERATGLSGYPRARSGHPVDHFCIGWAYERMGCVKPADRALRKYVYGSHRDHRDEAKALRKELSGQERECRVPGV